MRVHTSRLTPADIGTAPDGLHVEAYARGSRRRERAYEVKLTGLRRELPDGKRRRNNATNDGWAATYDEWGTYIAELYEKDPEAVVGPYPSRDGFHEMTGGRYRR